MFVLFVANSSLAIPSGGGRTRIISEAKQLAHHQIQVKLICFFHIHQLLTNPWLLVTGKKQLENEIGNKVYYVPKLPLRRLSSMYKLNNWYCGFLIFLICWFQNIKIVHGHGFTSALFALFAKRFNRSIKIILDAHGLWLEEANYNKNNISPQLTWLYERYEKILLQEANWILVVSQAMQRYFEAKHGIDLANVLLIPMATETTFEIDFSERQLLRKRYGLENRIVFCYLGSLRAYQLPDVMGQLFGELVTAIPEAFFLILSHYKDAFADSLQRANIDANNYYITAVDHEDVFNLLQTADIGLLLRDDSIINQVASPTKFAEYTLCGLPVIVTNYVGDMSALVARYKIGWIADLNNLSVTEALIAFVKDVQENRTDYAQRCSMFAKAHFSWDVYGPQLAEIYAIVERS